MIQWFLILLISHLVSCSPLQSSSDLDGKETWIVQNADTDMLEQFGLETGLVDYDGSDRDSFDIYNFTHALSWHNERNASRHKYNLLIHKSPRKRGSKNVGVSEELLQDFIKEDVQGANKDESMYLGCLDDIINKLRMWMEHIPRVHPFYAIKCNDDPNVVKILGAMGAGFDCASISEIDQVLSMGILPSKIIFANPVKSVFQLKYAKDRGVKYMTFDCESELEKIAKHYPEAKVVIRLKVSDVGAGHQLGDKFGVHEKDHEKMLKEAMKLNLTVAGVAFHVGSIQKNPQTYYDALKVAKGVFDLSQDLGLKRFNVLDIGGGYPGTVDFDDPDDLFYQMADLINSGLDEMFPIEDYPHLKIISEPGRYFPTSAFVLITKVLGKKLVKLNDTVNAYYYINDGLYHSFLTHLIHYDVFDRLIPHSDDGKAVEDRDKLLTTIFGQTFYQSDYLIKNKLFPEVEIGEHIIINDFGAYTMSFRSNFNRYSRPSIKYVISEDNKKYLIY